MAKWTKRPLEIDAHQLLLSAPMSNYNQFNDWATAHGVSYTRLYLSGSPRVMVYTTDWRFPVYNTAWLIKGILGEFYTISNAEFEAYYTKLLP